MAKKILPQRTVSGQSKSGPSRPSKPAPSTQYSPNNLGEGTVKTVNDGTTQVKTSVDPEEKQLNKYMSRHLGAITVGDWKKYGPENIPPCINPTCKSYGRPHPNCMCYSSAPNAEFAEGGEVHFCSKGQPHKAGCPYEKGGQVVQDNPQETMAHAAIHQGLLGLLKEVGHPKMAEPEKHQKHFEKVQKHILSNDHEKAAEALTGHPLAGSAGKNALMPIMERLSGPLMNQDFHPQGMRSAVDYLASSMKGRDKLDSSIKNLLGKSEQTKPDEKAREALKQHLNEIQFNPDMLMDSGGDIGEYLPAHGAQMGALAGAAINHFSQLKPSQPQGAPFDDMMAVDKNEQSKYHRQLDIAQNPLLILDHAKDGTLLPSDLKTVVTLYPSLLKTMADKAMEKIVEAKSKGEEIPYRQRISFSMLLGMPLDSTMTLSSMQTIINSAGPQQMQNQAKGPKKATGVELKQLNKVDDMYPTESQQRQLDKKD